jgi:zinc protease
MISIPHEKFTLSNGLQVMLHEDHRIPMAAVNLWYHVGSKNDDTGRTGFAHLFEHVMFEGSKNYNKLFFGPLQDIGASVNGSTSSDRTNYWENVPSEYLELALWLESDRMGFLLETLDQERLDLQREVVKNERRETTENRPYGIAHVMLQPMIFPPPHPYSWPIIGSQEDLSAASLEDVKGFFRRFYSPSNASLAIAGDFDGSEVRRLVERYFGDIPAGPPIHRLERLGSTIKGEARLDVIDKVPLPRLQLVWPSPPAFDVDEAPLDILATVLADGKSSRLYRSLVYEKQIARDVSVWNYAQEIAGEFMIQATASPGHTLDEVQVVVEEELERIRRDPPSAKEIARAFNRIESQHVMQLEHLGGSGGIADQLNYYNVIAGAPGIINTDIQRYEAVSPEDTTRVAHRYLQSDRVRLAVLPEQTTSTSASSVDRSVMPGGAKPKGFTTPVPRRETLANGLDVLYVEKPGLPLVGMGVVLRVGATNDPLDAPGLAQMTTAMLAEGTSNRTSQQIAEEMEFLGSSLHTTTGREHMVVSAETLTAHWPRAMDVMADVLKNPSFPPHELERVRKERLADLKRIATDPTAISHRATRALVYGPDTAYGHSASGTESSVNAMTREAMIEHFTEHCGPQNATLLAVGDIKRDELMSRAAQYFGDWTASAASGPVAPDGPGESPAATTVYLVDRPGAPQSVIRAAHKTITRLDPDYYPLFLVNYIFGGHATARLFMNLRQDKGYTYGYYSQIDWLNGPSALTAGGSVQTAVTKEALAETLKEFADIRGGRPVTQDELDKAKEGIFRGFPSQFESQGQVLQQLSRVVMFGLPDDYYSTIMANLDRVTLEDARAVASSRIDNGHLIVLIVGDRAEIEPGLNELGLPVVAVDNEGRPI